MNTLGDHLRKVRIDRGLSQPQVAKVLNVTTDTVTYWETNRNEPTAKFARAIIEFLGYLPFSFDESSIGKQLYYARLITGNTQKQVAKAIGCDASNLRYIELDSRRPHGFVKQQIQAFIEKALETLDTVNTNEQP